MSSLFAGAVAVLSLAAGPMELTRHVPEYATRRHGAQTVRQDRNVSDDVAREILKKRNIETQEKPHARLTILAIPGQPNRYLVIDVDPPEEGDQYGLRLFLFEVRKGAARQLARSAPMSDSYVLEPVVFTGGGRVIVVAAIGTEYSWGNEVWELAGDSLRHLGNINAAIPGAEGEEDPTPFAHVLVQDRSVLIRYDTDLVLGITDPDTRRLSGPVVFRHHDGDGFLADPAPPRRAK